MASSPEAPVVDIVDMMEEERGEAGTRKDASARAKFDAFLNKHVERGSTMMSLSKSDVTEEMMGKFLSYMTQSLKVNTASNYLASVKRQLIQQTGTTIFDHDAFYQRCRRRLTRVFYKEAERTGKLLEQQAPPMTLADLALLAKALFAANTPRSLMERSLLVFQWVSLGRSSDVAGM
ncbi:hypothetical protein BBJ28_00024280, partial [Nothophytophthora sp. Chile5]